MKNTRDKQARKYQLTDNHRDNICVLPHDVIKETLFVKFKTFQFGAMADEKGKNGVHHTHIFCCFSAPVRFSMMKKYFPTAHIESAKGTIEENLKYLKKEGKWAKTEKSDTTISGTYEEFGERPPENKGKRKDLEDLYHMIVDEELSNAEILALNQDYIMEIDKLDKLRTIHLQEKFKGTRRLDIDVTYVFGVTGSGKSKDILDEYGDENVYRVTDYDHPFDGYCCESVIVFEEFRSSLPLKDMLNYLDIYPIQLKARYNNKYACYTKVYLCTNWKLEKQYREVQNDDIESWEALLRRIHKVKEYTDKGKYRELTMNEYLHKKHQFQGVTELTPEEQLELMYLFQK